jgi:TolB-like protein/tetratricopeptide (TPR) repeat protein
MSGDSLEKGDAAQSSVPLSRDVFISYASQDAAVGNSVVEALESQGIRCWIAPRDVTPGEFYADAIVRALDEARALVLVLSQHAAISHHILREVERASSKRHPVISLRIDRAALPAGLEYFLNTSQWLDASEVEPSRVFPRLVEAVRKVLAGAATESGGNTGQSAPPSELTRGTRRRSVSRPIAIVLSLVVVAIMGFAIDRWWVSKQITAQKPVAVAPVAPIIGPAIPEKSVAVLPFVDMSEKRDQEYFSDGLTEELIDMLTKVPDLRVPARTSSFYFKGKAEDIPTIGRRLMVAHVLEGSVRKSGRNLRITVQLVRADNGYHLWSETYDRKVDDIFKVQDEIAGAVVKTLKGSLLVAAVPRIAVTSNTDAYTLYLRALDIGFREPTKAGIEREVGYLQQVIRLDSGFAPAWAVLAKARTFQLEVGWILAHDAEDQARHAALQAVALDPNLSAAHVSMARVHFFFDWDWAAADAELKRALELDPANSDALRWAGSLATTLGRASDATAYLLQAIDRDPLSPANYAKLTEAYLAAGKFDTARQVMQRILDLSPHGAFPVSVHRGTGDLLVITGHATDAMTEYELAGEEDDRLRGHALAFFALGRKTEAEDALRQLRMRSEDTDAYTVAEIYSFWGNLEEAFAWLGRSLERREIALTGIKNDLLLAKLRGDQRYGTLLRKMNLPE